jgi:prevent-host-death family protein
MREISLAAMRASIEQLIRMAEDENGVMLTSDNNNPLAVILDINHYRSLQGLVELAYSGQWSDIYADYERRALKEDLTDVYKLSDPQELP